MGGSPEADGTASLPTPPDGELALSPLSGDSGWRVAGEITLATRRDGEQMLDGLVRSDAPVCHLELSVTERPPASMWRLLEMFWPKLHAIEVVSC
ncbi:hypothetical protein [Streptomyces sp. NPDC055013]